MSTTAGPTPDDAIEWVSPEHATAAGTPAAAQAEHIRHGGGRGSHRSSAHRPRRTLIVLAVIACVGAGAAVWWILRPDAPLRITASGATVEHPQQVLHTAETRLGAYVSQMRGVRSRSTRCYFRRADSAAVRTDVTSTLYCGPVLFFGGSEESSYLSYALVTQHSGQQVTFAVSANPISPHPVAVPAAELARPDRRHPPRAAGGLTVPVPPPGPASLLAAEPATAIPVTIALAPATAVIGSRNTTLTLESSGFIPYYGSVATARSAPPGSRLLAFQLEFDWNQSATISTTHLSAGIQTDSGPVRPLSLSGITLAGQYFVAAVPTSARDVTLILTDEGLAQRLSLVTGTPAADNIRVLTGRSDTTVNATRTGAVVADVHASTEFTAHLEVQVFDAELLFFLADGTHPARNDHAFLAVNMCYSSTDFVDTTTCHSFRGSDLTLTIPGHQPQAAQLIRSKGDYYGVFDVPWNFDKGTITITGSEHAPQGWSMTIVSPWSFPVDFAKA